MLIDENNIEQIIDTIRKLHQTTIDQRLIDFTEYLNEFFQSIQVEQSNVFEILTRLLHDYDDRAALKIEFVKAQCFEIIAKILNTNENHLIVILEFILELLNNSENVREKFLCFNGYEKFFSSLRYIHSPSMRFINQFIFLMIEKSIFLNDDSTTPLIDSFVVFINPHIAKSLIQWIPYLTNTADQQYIISSIEKIVLRSLQNKMMACSNGIILSLLEILNNNEENSNPLEETILFNILSLLENLTRFSINVQEIRYIFQLFNQNISFKKRLLELLIIAAKHNDPDIHDISAYFDLQRPNSGIVLPVIRRLPSVSSSSTPHHFTFHCWLRLNHEVHSYPYEGRRQIYSFYSDSIGLESFIRNSSIFVLMTDHRETVYIELNDCDDLIDGYWHSLTIVHTAQRSSLFVSAFQTTLTCHLTIYIDGLLRKEIKDFKYVSIVNDPIQYASIGSPSQRPKESVIRTKNESISTTLVKTIQPFKGLFSSKSKQTLSRKDSQGFYSQHVLTIDSNTQDTIFGPSISLYGQIASLSILTETFDDTQIKHLHDLGANFCHPQPCSISGGDDTSFHSFIHDILTNRSIVAYHPLACNGQICIDISTSSLQNNGRLINGSCLRIQSFSQALLNIGGCPVLYPLVEVFQENAYDQSNNMVSSNESTYSNPIASIISLIHCVLSSSSTILLTEQIIKHSNIEILGDYLIHISSYLINEQFLLSIEQLIDSSRSIDPSYLLTTQLIQYLILDFNLWNKAAYNIRTMHLHYIFKLMKEDKKFDREKFGVQFFLDILKQYFNLSKDDTEEEQKLRSIVYLIIKHLIQLHLRIKDISSILSTLSTISLTNDIIAFELLNLILCLIDSSTTINETIIDNLNELNMIEGLYSLLIINNLTSETKEMIFKIIKYFLESKRVSQQIRTLIRLETNHIGFGGIISGMALNELNQKIVQEILDLITTSHSSIAVSHLNIVLTLCSAASLEVRYIAVRKLMTYFLSHPSACRLYAKCHGWQETLAHFFVKLRRPSMPLLSSNFNSSQNILINDIKDQNLDSSQGSSLLIDINENNQQLTPPSPIFDLLTNPNDSSDKQIPKDDIVDQDLIQILTTDPSRSTSLNNLNDSKGSTNNYSDYPNETIITPPQSISASSEDLLSLIKPEISSDNLVNMVRNDSNMSSPLPRTHTMSGVTNIEDSRFFLRSPVNIGDGTILEEMCETLILSIVMIFWKGIPDSDDAAWTARGEIFTALRHLHREYDLYLPLNHIERRILELSMETCLNEIKADVGRHGSQDRITRRRFSLSGVFKQTPTYENNCRELIKLVNDYLSQSDNNYERITENLVNGIIPILDTMLVFTHSDSSTTTSSVNHNDHLSETSITGLNTLLILLGHPNVSFCSQASIRLHSLLNSRPLNSREEAAYLLSTINKIFLTNFNNENSEHASYMLGLLNVIVEKSYDLLEMNETIPKIPLSDTTPDDVQESTLKIKSDDWQNYIQQITEPYADHYQSMSIRPFQMNMKIWWNNCHEMMNIAIHKRNRQIETEKIRFQTHIVQLWQRRSRLEDHRIAKLNEQRRIHHNQVHNEWKNEKKYLYGERGPWFNDKYPKEHYWILSDRENIHRMRCKLIENNYFNKHEGSSRLRDNLSVDKLLEIDENILQESLKTESKETSHGNVTDEHIEISNEIHSLLSEEKEKIIIGSKCSLISLTSITDGEFIITDKYMYFFNLTRLKNCQNIFKYPLLLLQDIQLRRYNLQPTALEFFLTNQRNFLLNFDKNKKSRRHIFQKLMSLKLPAMKNAVVNNVTTITPQDVFKESKITEKWVTREISNFDYLIMLNTIAGRTYNDLNQYPVFPWVIKDYTSQVLDINNPQVFRDFSKPIGIQNPKHIEEVKLKYESFEDPTGLIKKFHYGTHYSNAACVMHYLIRMEPFTTLHIQLQSGKFDIADRQFHCFQSSWTNIMDSPNDGKELIPEFFYFPEFLSNSNQFDLGKLQSNNQFLNDVQLPPWAHDSPEEFIRLHRLALESDYVSSHLHEWIDLIFGYKQRGQAAVDALNVFMYCSYEKGVDYDTIDDSVTREAIDGMIQNFGQIPTQLLTEPHPQRQTREQSTSFVETQGRSLNIFQNLSNVKAFFVEVTTSDDKSANPITFISIPKIQIRSFMQQGTPDILITINTKGVIGNNGWHPFDKTLNNFFTFERDPTLQLERNRLTTLAPFSPSIEINSRLFVASHDAKFLFSGGHWDYSLRIYSLVKSKTVNSIIRHTNIITCLTLDSTGYILVTGSRDTTCIIWHLSFNNEQDTSSLITPELKLYGHTAEITCVCVSSELDLVVSGSLDGTCNIYTVEQGVYLRTLRPTDHNFEPIINLKLSDERHILIQTEKDDTHLFLYSINGSLIRTRKFEYRIVDMLLADQYIILAVNHNSSTDQTSATSVASRVIIKDIFEMTTIQAIRLRTQIVCLYITKDYSHLLVSVKDGKIFVITPDKKSIQKSSLKN